MRSGRPEKLPPEEQGRVQQLFKVHARAPRRIAGEIFKETGKPVSVDTIKRIGKKSRLRWKRIRRSLKARRNPHAFEQGQEVIDTLRA